MVRLKKKPTNAWVNATDGAGDFRMSSLDAPRQLPNSESSSITHFHAHTVKNLSSCSSRAYCPSVSRMDVKDP
jgi:hypothetical protein